MQMQHGKLITQEAQAAYNERLYYVFGVEKFFSTFQKNLFRVVKMYSPNYFLHLW